MSSEPYLEFGIQSAEEVYLPRPGSYAVCLRHEDHGDLVAIVQTPQGAFLPGGGACQGESAEETLLREVLEECGRSLTILERLGFALEYVNAPGEGCFAKQCTFFLVRLGDADVCESEADHELVWMPVATALNNLTHQSQAWAVSIARPVISTSARQSSH
ncbi:NUDIX domain-containing protein [Schlesneria paludicola]|uniref:NUDIX domain-containing protein n=1 Tax=Schlesneria paludicola TaxID=360056 RepID=UPI00029B482E|nr:NUDIX domain-containing protein [Schlesneria paludicola]